MCGLFLFSRAVYKYIYHQSTLSFINQVCLFQGELFIWQLVAVNGSLLICVWLIAHKSTIPVCGSLSARAISPVHSNKRLTAITCSGADCMDQTTSFHPLCVYVWQHEEMSLWIIFQSEKHHITEMWINSEKKEELCAVKKWDGLFQKRVVLKGVWACCAYIVLRDNSDAECARACLYEPLYWNAGPGHSAAHSFNFCKHTNSRRLQDHTAFMVKH